MKNDVVYQLTMPPPGTPLLPIVISVPHCGTKFPDDLINDYKADLLPPDDTDWMVDKLYDFAPSLGIPLLSAVYSRWVVDVNRDPNNVALYNDGRVITDLCTTTNFLGEPIYKDKRARVAAGEIERRKALYYTPYHQKIEDLLNNALRLFGKVLLWDCHSIRQRVPSIHEGLFPDLILGSADDTSAGGQLQAAVLESLHESDYSFSKNHPFKGGYITRNFGKPALQQHALQLEMSKVNYMNDDETQYSDQRAGAMRELLKRTLLKAAEVLGY